MTDQTTDATADTAQAVVDTTESTQAADQFQETGATDTPEEAQEAPQEAPKAIPAIAVPTQLWAHISTYVGTRPWNQVRDLRKQISEVLTSRNLHVEGTPIPPLVPVSVLLWNATFEFLVTCPCDDVEGILTDIETFINALKAQAVVHQEQQLQEAVAGTPEAAPAA